MMSAGNLVLSVFVLIYISSVSAGSTVLTHNLLTGSAPPLHSNQIRPRRTQSSLIGVHRNTQFGALPGRINIRHSSVQTVTALPSLSCPDESDNYRDDQSDRPLISVNVPIESIVFDSLFGDSCAKPDFPDPSPVDGTFIHDMFLRSSDRWENVFALFVRSAAKAMLVPSDYPSFIWARAMGVAISRAIAQINEPVDQFRGNPDLTDQCRKRLSKTFYCRGASRPVLSGDGSFSPPQNQKFYKRVQALFLLFVQGAENLNDLKVECGDPGLRHRELMSERMLVFVALTSTEGINKLQNTDPNRKRIPNHALTQLVYFVIGMEIHSILKQKGNFPSSLLFNQN
uniref:Uncharacterized protein n=1 Tax=Spongospora subterranea TaxID=70186 RepID=A0A0H5R6U8_9EUKA|eukprot:CRZ09850.1 hypothetical protein [Spongospora subterranea]